MKPGYAPDNTRSSIAVVVLVALAVAVFAALVGLSEKPDISAIGITISAEEAANAPAGVSVSDDSTNAGDDFDDGVESDAQRDSDLPAATLDDGFAASEAVPSPEVAAAVEPLDAGDDVDDALAPLDLGSAVSPGVTAGSFFTRPDEDANAIVSRNELSLTINEDGTGLFAGVLDMTLADSTQITLAMSGPFTWHLDAPQVAAQMTGTYHRDSPIAADDVEATEGELTITSLATGSGSLCTQTCFGFTFPPQSGF